MPVTIGGSGPITGVTSINTTVSDTELGYLDGVSSALQTQINAKANDSSQGLYLITPTSIANSGGSASASGGTVTFSGVTSVSLNGVFSATYDVYRVVIWDFQPNAAREIKFRLRASGSDTASNYLFANSGVDTGGTARTLASATTTYGSLTYFTTNDQHVVMDLAYPFAASITTMTGSALGVESTGANLYCGWRLSALHTATTQFDGLTVYADAGSVSGQMSVFGYKR